MCRIPACCSSLGQPRGTLRACTEDGTEDGAEDGTEDGGDAGGEDGGDAGDAGEDDTAGAHAQAWGAPPPPVSGPRKRGGAGRGRGVLG